MNASDPEAAICPVGQAHYDSRVSNCNTNEPCDVAVRSPVDMKALAQLLAFLSTWNFRKSLWEESTWVRSQKSVGYATVCRVATWHSLHRLGRRLWIHTKV